MNRKIELEMKDVTITLGNNEILKNINLKIYENEIVVLIGPSGSGKTVLLKSLAGLYTPSKGHIFIEGEDWQKIEGERKHHLTEKVGIMFQQSALFDQMTVLENVEFPLKEHFDYSKEEVDRIAIELLKKVNLYEHLEKKPGELSGGMQKRLAIARALALSPSIVFYDDPVAGQDPIQSDQVTKLIKELKEKNNATTVIVSSNMRLAFELADRIIMVIDKSIIDSGTSEQTWNSTNPIIQQFIKGNLEGPISIRK